MTAARVPLPHWSTQSRPCRHSRPTPAVYGPAYVTVFARFPNKWFIAVGKFERNMKYHLSMSSKLGFRVTRWNRNDTFSRAFIKSLLFFASHRDSAVGNVAWRLRAGAGTAAPRPAVSRCGRQRATFRKTSIISGTSENGI